MHYNLLAKHSLQCKDDNISISSQHSGILFTADYDVTRKHDYHHWSTIETTGISEEISDTAQEPGRTQEPVSELPAGKRNACLCNEIMQSGHHLVQSIDRTTNSQDVDRAKDVDKGKTMNKKPPTISFPSTCNSTTTKPIKKVQ